MKRRAESDRHNNRMSVNSGGDLFFVLLVHTIVRLYIRGKVTGKGRMLPGIQRPWSRVPEYVLIEDLVPSGLMAVNYISSGRCNFFPLAREYQPS